MKEKKSAAEILCGTALFGGLSPAGCAELSSAAAFVEVPQGMTLSRPGDLGYIVSGKAEVLRGGDRKVVINVLSRGDFFGMADLGQKNAAGAEIRAKLPCGIIFVPGDAVTGFVRSEPEFAAAYVGLISSKLRFLSRRVKLYSSESATSRLAGFMLAVRETSLPVAELGRRLDLGRTSLYRALEMLEKAGALKKEGKKIDVLDPSVLGNYCD
ncbi:MAG: Crp/Fnr family transcriptional regulator [Clostridia bacterium]|nr:Crp/Fnr family transcriptional regulator [Clostridia bacterium]